MNATLRHAAMLGCAFGCAGAIARAAPEQAAQLDTPALTCLGAQRSGSPGGVAAYTGKYLGKWPGIQHDSGYERGPYFEEKPLSVINSKNLSGQVTHLTPGQQALLQKYPDRFRINVYPSHRDFRLGDDVCQATKRNAAVAEVVHDGRGVAGIRGGVVFPFPQNGLEAIWNVATAPRAWSESVTADSVVVYANGAKTWGKSRFVDMDPNTAQKERSLQERIAAYFYISYLAPERDKGKAAVGYAPMDFSNDATQSWEYMPGLRRVRQAPEVGFDYPVPPAGMHVSDEDSIYNGSPERFQWTLQGKKEIYVPYNNFVINDPALKYEQLVLPFSVNPDYERYELHRVWVIEGTLRPGLRHIYGRRVIYADEDTWVPLWADNYDTRGKLWRVNLANWFYSQESSTFHRGVTVYHDLDSSAYEATYLVNESGNGWWRLNQKFPLTMFTPSAIARGGH